MSTDIGTFFSLASGAAIEAVRASIGHPFGATLVRDGEVVCVASNTVTRDKDPSTHAEMAAVREGCRILDTLDLSDCTVYATGEPCPLRQAVMLMAGIRCCYYASTQAEAAERGFPDADVRAHLDGSDVSELEIVHVTEGREDCDEIWVEFEKRKG